MDPEILGWLLQQLLADLASNASIILISFFSVGVLGLGPIGRGLGRRLRGSTAAEDEAQRLRAEVELIQERLDFSERVLHQLRAPMEDPEHTEPTTGAVTPH
jgi:hypothetical protein